MARYRTIKPEFWSSPQVVECSINARLLFIGIWSFSDDGGVHPLSAKRLKMEIFPGDDISSDSILRLLDELIMNELLVAYIVDNKEYIQVTGWSHQRIDKPTYKFPVKNEGVVKPISRALCEDSYSTMQQSRKESKGEESKVEEKKENNIDELSNSCANNSSSKSESPVRMVFDHWRGVMKTPKSKLDSKRIGKVKAALKLGFTVDELKLAIEGCLKSDWHMGRDKNNSKMFNDLELILRDASHIESFIKKNHEKSALQKKLDQIDAGEI